MREVSLIYLFNLAWRKIWFLLAAFVVAAGIAFGYCKLVATPRYAAKASVLVTNGGMTASQTADGSSKSVANGDIAASINIVSTVVDILKTDDIYKSLASQLGGKYSYSELSSNATVESRGEKTMFIDVTFTASTENEALKLVNGFAELAPDYIEDSIPNSYTKYYVAERANMIYPTTARTTILFALLGAIVMYGILLLVDILDRGIKGEEDYAARFDIPMLGTVPDFEAVSMPSAYSASRGGNAK